MIFVRLYRAEGETEGGGSDNPPKKPTPPSGYRPLTSAQRRDWNDFLDHLQKQGVAGSKELDQLDKNAVKPYMDQYRKENPNTTVSEDIIPSVQYEHEVLRTGNSFAGMTPEQTRVMRKQFNDAFVSRAIARQGLPFDSTLSRQYYPTFRKGDKDYGTDAEAYMKDFATLPAKSGNGSAKDDIIPYPDYNDPKSRSQYLANWAKKYGNLEGRGDTVLKVNEIPRGGSDTAKNLSVKTAKEFGLDPALLYSSAMEEGMSGLFKNKDGTDTKHRKPGDFGYQDFYGDKEFPINGGQNFGFQTFAERFPELVKGGYLPKEFSKEFRGVKAALADDAQYADANNFKSTDAALKAKAAMLKYSYDEADKYAKEKGINLSKKAKDFFALVLYNGGEGGLHKLLNEYKQKGLLTNDNFLKENPHKGEKIPENQDIYAHVIRRIRMADALKEQRHFASGDSDQDTASK